VSSSLNPGHEGAARLPRVEVDPDVPVRRKLSLFDVLCMGVNAIVGSGVFALPDDMQREMGGWSPFAYVLCAIVLIPIALSFAELSSRCEETGAAYVYARRAFGAKAGFFVGWYCWATTFVAWAANTTLFIEILGFSSYPLNKILCVASVVVLGMINYIGVKPGAWLVNVVTIGKLTAIFCFLAVAVFAIDPGRLGGPLPLGLAGVGQGVYLALFPLQGFEVAPVAAGETQNPRRNVPLGTIGSILFSALLFIIVQTVLVGVYPRLTAESEQPLVDAARYLSQALGVLVLIGSLISIGGYNAGSALGAPRYAQAIAEHRLLPAALARIHWRWGTPHVAIGVTTLITALLAFFYDYRKLVGMTNTVVLVQYLFTCLAVPVLRVKDKEETKGWVIPGGPIVPLFGALGTVALFFKVVVFTEANRTELQFAAVTLVIGIAVALISSRRAAKQAR
jgi:amino acid transporter